MEPAGDPDQYTDFMKSHVVLAIVALFLAGCMTRMEMPPPDLRGSNVAVGDGEFRLVSELADSDGAYRMEPSEDFMRVNGVVRIPSSEPCCSDSRYERRTWDVESGLVISSVEIAEPDPHDFYSGWPDWKMPECRQVEIDDRHLLLRAGQSPHELVPDFERVSVQTQFATSQDCKWLAGAFRGLGGIFGKGDDTPAHLRVWDVSSGQLHAWFMDDGDPRNIHIYGFLNDNRTLLVHMGDDLIAYDIDAKRVRSRMEVGRLVDSMPDGMTFRVANRGERFFRFEALE